MRKTLLSNAGFLAIGAVSATIGWHIIGPMSAVGGSNADTYRQLNLFGDVFDRIRSDYVEVPDDEKLVDSAISGMLTSLDPHSSYMNAKRFQDMQVQTRGEFGGLGIEVTMENGVVKVVAPIDDTPAAKAGVLAGDLIYTLSQPGDSVVFKANPDKFEVVAQSDLKEKTNSSIAVSDGELFIRTHEALWCIGNATEK